MVHHSDRSIVSDALFRFSRSLRTDGFRIGTDHGSVTLLGDGNRRRHLLRATTRGTHRNDVVNYRGLACHRHRRSESHGFPPYRSLYPDIALPPWPNEHFTVSAPLPRSSIISDHPRSPRQLPRHLERRIRRERHRQPRSRLRPTGHHPASIDAST